MKTAAKVCARSATHAPTPHQIDTHHIVPVSWKVDGTDWYTVDLCAGCHHNVHALIDAYIRAGGEPAWDVIRHFTAVERQLAAAAWAGRPNDHPPITELNWGGA